VIPNKLAVRWPDRAHPVTPPFDRPRLAFARDDATGSDKQPGMSERILLVEDDFLVAMQMESTLTEAGFEVVGVASSGEDAIELAISERPRLVVMDIRLAGDRDGIDTALQLHFRDCPSGRACAPARRAGGAAGLAAKALFDAVPGRDGSPIAQGAGRRDAVIHAPSICAGRRRGVAVAVVRVLGHALVAVRHPQHRFARLRVVAALGDRAAFLRARPPLPAALGPRPPHAHVPSDPKGEC
jgi:hypothetical protein